MCLNVRSVPSIRNKGSRLVPKSFRMGMEKLHSAVRDEILPVQCSYCEFDAQLLIADLSSVSYGFTGKVISIPG